jgi:hypothetical protein
VSVTESGRQDENLFHGLVGRWQAKPGVLRECVGKVNFCSHFIHNQAGQASRPSRSLRQKYFRAVSKILWPPRQFLANEKRVSVVDCGSPLPLCVARLPVKKRQRAAAVQNLAESSSRFSGAATVFVKPL